ncbi:hypothetical protein B0H13DRAFT_1897144 [Mycena leptocephala]|nr:hypothetical protein B0H13DRAFT_1897144 [Mycena leptocephala]
MPLGRMLWVFWTSGASQLASLRGRMQRLWYAPGLELAPYLEPVLQNLVIAFDKRPRIQAVPVLLDCMVYGEDDLLWLEGDAKDVAIPEKDTDIKPHHYGSTKSHGLERDANIAQPPKSCIGAYGEEAVDSDEGDYNLDDEDFADEMSTEWNLRMCAALDVLAVHFGGELLNVLLGLLKEKLWSSGWLQRESGILVVNHFAQGGAGFLFSSDLCALRRLCTAWERAK